MLAGLPALMGQQDRQARGLQDSARSAPEYELLQAVMSVGPHHQHVRFLANGYRLQRVAN